MDQDPNKPAPRKVRFKPKPRQPPTTAPTTQIESSSNANADADDDETDKTLQRKVEDHLARHRPKNVEKKSPMQVAFQAGSSAAIMTFGKPKEGTEDGKKEVQKIEGSHRERPNPLKSHHRPILLDGTDEIMEDLAGPTTTEGNGAEEKKKKSYREPWDYENSYYPTTLPLRRPYSGNPEVLDTEEFGGDAKKYDEDAINPASELGLLEEQEDGKPKLLLFQLPPLPSSGKDFPEGHIGKMMVHRSGAVKMKIGDVLYEVSPGVEVACPQDLMAVDTKSRNCVKSGEIDNCAVVAPDVDSILDDI